MSRYISLLEYPQTPVSIGQEVSIDVLAARFGNGEISTSLVEIEMFAGELTTSLQSRDNPFTFGFDFTVSSQMNTTFSIVLGGKLTSADCVIINLLMFTSFLITCNYFIFFI